MVGNKLEDIRGVLSTDLDGSIALLLDLSDKYEATHNNLKMQLVSSTIPGEPGLQLWLTGTEK